MEMNSGLPFLNVDPNSDASILSSGAHLDRGGSAGHHRPDGGHVPARPRDARPCDEFPCRRFSDASSRIQPGSRPAEHRLRSRGGMRKQTRIVPAPLPRARDGCDQRGWRRNGKSRYQRLEPGRGCEGRLPNPCSRIWRIAATGSAGELRHPHRAVRARTGDSTEVALPEPTPEPTWAGSATPVVTTTPRRTTRSSGSRSKELRDPSEGTININTASQTQLERLPRVGPSTAKKIIEYRREHGGFRTVDELLEIRGIGPKTMEQLRPFVTLE